MLWVVLASLVLFVGLSDVPFGWVFVAVGIVALLCAVAAGAPILAVLILLAVTAPCMSFWHGNDKRRAMQSSMWLWGLPCTVAGSALAFYLFGSATSWALAIKAVAWIGGIFAVLGLMTWHVHAMKK